jgi:hypothetical protein
MRKTASEDIRNLESRIAKLEKQSRNEALARLELMADGSYAFRESGTVYYYTLREIKKAIKDWNLTEVLSERSSDEIKLIPSDHGESRGYDSIGLYLSKENIVKRFVINLGINVNK